MKYVVIVLAALAISCGDYSSFRQIGPPPSDVDYPGFIMVTAEVEDYRKERLISAQEFAKKAQEKGVIILDTRSKAAYDKIHVKGAVHLNFSDFTKERLTKVIPDKNTPILIYCNNNVDTPNPALMHKTVSLALNIPTFINLYGYGYKNVYELKDLIRIHNPYLTFAGTSVVIQPGIQKRQTASVY